MTRCLPLNNVEDVVPHIYDSQLFYNVWRQVSSSPAINCKDLKQWQGENTFYGGFEKLEN